MKISAVKLLVAANALVFVLQSLSKGALDELFALWPLQAIDGESYFHFWQIITYAFLHSTDNITHLLFNMLGLWMFGAEVERYVGPRRLLACYFASVVSAFSSPTPFCSQSAKSFPCFRPYPCRRGCLQLSTQASSSSWALPGLCPESRILPTWAAWWAARW